MSRPRAKAAPHAVVRTDWPGWIATGLFVCLLGLTVARTTLGEPPFGRSAFRQAGGLSESPADIIHQPGELIRVASATLILALVALWAICSAVRGRLVLHHPWFAVFGVVLAVCLFVSAGRAADKREAVNAAVEQVSFVMAALLAMQLARPQWRRRLLVVVLAGMGTMLGAKGVYQVLVEIPETQTDFEADKAKYLAAQGIEPDSAQAKLFEVRVGERTTKGWFGQANVFGSLMILTMLTSVGLAVDKFLAWRAGRADRPAAARAPPTKAGHEVPLHLVAAILSALLAGLPLVTWALTRSAGALAAGSAASLAAVGIWLCRKWAARHRRGLLLAAAGTLVAGGAAVATWGLQRGTLPSASMSVRWDYWSASGRVFAARPLLGVGPGNFADWYLRFRRPGAEEQVRNPHNVVMQVASEYGLAGAAAYLGLLAFVLVKLTAPREPDSDAPQAGASRGVLLCLVVLALAVLWRLAVSSYPTAVVAFADNFVPAFALLGGLLAAVWMGGRGSESLSGANRFARVALACGLGGFALHNLTGFALFQPGAAMVFWVAGGGLVAGAKGRQWTLKGSLAAGAVAVLVLAVAGACVVALAPVWARTTLSRQAALDLSAGRASEGLSKLNDAVAADKLDAAAADDLAQLYLARATVVSPDRARQDITRAVDAAATACKRRPAHTAYWQTYFSAAAEQLGSGLPTLARRQLAIEAVDRLAPLDPHNHRLRFWLAQFAWRAGQPDTAAEQLEAALANEAALAPGSAYRFTEDERESIRHLREELGAVR